MVGGSPKKTSGYVRLKTVARAEEQGGSKPRVRFSSGSANKLQAGSPTESKTNGDVLQNFEDPVEEVTSDSSQLSFQSTADDNQVCVKAHRPIVQTASWKLKLLVFVCGVIMVTGMTLIIHFHNNKSNMIVIGKSLLGEAQLSLSEKILSIVDSKLNTKLEVALAGKAFGSLSYETSQNCGSSSDGFCLRWPSSNTTLTIDSVTSDVFQENGIHCYKVSWTYQNHVGPKDCIFLDVLTDEETKDHAVWFDTQWYVMWPHVQDSACTSSCYEYSSVQSQDEPEIGGVLVEPMWLSSQASLLKASLQNPVKACTKLCRNASRSTVCLQTEAETTKLINLPVKKSNLTYTVCSASNISQLHQGVMSALVRPASEDVTNIPFVKDASKKVNTMTNPAKETLSQACSTLLDKPLWNIALNGDAYDSSIIEEELSDIRAIGGTGVVYNMSDLYERIGDFDLHRRSKVKAEDFLTALHRSNLKAMLPVSPFVNYNAKNFLEAVRKGFLINNEFNGSPLLTDATVLGAYTFPGIVDFTNPDASTWFAEKIKVMMKNTTADFVQFLHSKVWLTPLYKLHAPLPNPGFYSTLYSNVANYINSCPVTDVAFSSQSQNQIVLLRGTNGMEDTLKVALASGLAGYPFFIPNLPFRLEEVDMLTPEQLEDGFIRWVQLVSFFPVAHMPWDFHVLKNRGLNITRITEMVKKCFSLRHSEVIMPVLSSAFVKAESYDRRPIISPIWMAPGLPGVSNGDFATEKIFLIQDQFLIGNDIMIAPVLQMGMRNRNVYFPPGSWAKLTTPTLTIQSDGTVWKKNFPVGLEDILIFARTQA